MHTLYSSYHSENELDELPKSELSGFRAKVEESGECLPLLKKQCRIRDVNSLTSNERGRSSRMQGETRLKFKYICTYICTYK